MSQTYKSPSGKSEIQRDDVWLVYHVPGCGIVRVRYHFVPMIDQSTWSLRLSSSFFVSKFSLSLTLRWIIRSLPVSSTRPDRCSDSSLWTTSERSVGSRSSSLVYQHAGTSYRGYSRAPAVSCASPLTMT